MSKKGAAKPKDEITYEIGEVVLAKIRGFPAWPAQVVDPDGVSKEVAKERPAGKKATFYCVRFFPAGDHAWVPPKDLSKLKPHEIEAYINEPHKKSGDLLTGYRIALNPGDWVKDMEKKREEAEEAQEEQEVDELEGEEEGDDDEQPVKSKKRKRESDAGSKAKAKSKKEKESGDSASKKKKSSDKADKAAKSKKNGSKLKETVESEDEGERGESGGTSKKASPPATKKPRHSKDEEGDTDLEKDPEAQKVKDLRHKLQRAFLGKTPPKPEDMPNVDNLLKQIEEFDMPLKYLQYSKLGKVMRHIAALPVDKIPRDDEFKFKERAQALVNKWHSTHVSAPTSGKPNGSADGDQQQHPPGSTATANGNLGSAPSVLSDAQTVFTTANAVNEEKKTDGKVDGQQQPSVGDTTMAESALGDVTMSEVAA